MFGSSFVQTLMPLDTTVGGNSSAGNDSSESTSLESSDVPRAATFCGFVSKAGHGVGRSDNDRQFLFINGRPVDLSNVCGLFLQFAVNCL